MNNMSIIRAEKRDFLPIGSFLILMGMLLGLCSCSSVRGLPDHGGGKRFDEEQRMVSSSIQAAVEAMELSVLKGKKVRLVIDGMESSGGGRTSWTGIRHVSPSMNVREAGAGTEFTSVNYPMGYAIDASYTANNNLTSRDMKYLESFLRMRCELEGIQLVGNQQEVNFYVVVDVLGINRSRDDHLLVVRDHLHASTEITYCYIDAKTRDVIKEKSKVGSKASYSENWVRLTNLKGKSRALSNQIEDAYLLPPMAEALAFNSPSDTDGLEFQGEGREEQLLQLEFTNGVLKSDPVAAREAEKAIVSKAEELYKKGLEAIKRKDKVTLKKIIEEMIRKFPGSEYIDILKNRLGRREREQDDTVLAIKE